ncbi:Ku protein [Nitriliruptor alkaliphilus]|uniref:non-homologous end joining protein Ku n=1 Tax=Nitriliruptor alkaliphilus TaxID=427918 RepID=UPI0006971011|nr:Ku protein [Nitriliruptor alkaliphilus]
MARAIWSGAISFGLVNIPVKLVTAVDRRNVRFRELRREDASRVRYRKVAAADGEEVTSDQMVKGYEIAPDRYVVLEPDELKALAPESSRAIEIEDFVELAEIEPLYYDSSYYLVPGDTAAKPYALLHTAMRESGKAAVARFVLRTKQHLAIIRPVGDALAVSTVVYHDEVIPTEQLDGLPGEDVQPTDRELAMAGQLIESMTVAWEPERYRDTHRDQLLELIERKAAGEDITAAPELEREAGDVVDLVAALEASLAASRDGGSSAESA